MNESWYVVQGGSAQGPFDAATMASMVASGVLRADTQVCRVGDQAWRPAASDPSLGALLGVSAAGVPATWSFGAGWQATMRGFKRSWGPLMLLALVSLGLAIPGTILSQAFSAGMQATREPAVVGALLVAVVVVNLLNWLLVTIPIQQAGLTFAASKAAAGTVRVSDLFQGYRRLGMVLATGTVLMLAIGVAVGVACVPGVIMMVMGAALQQKGAAAGIPLVVGGAVLMGAVLLLALWLVYPYFYAPAVACDPAFGRPGFSECFRLSAQGLKGRVFGVFGFLFVIGVLAAASVLLLCIGYLLVGLPLLLAAQGAVYAICVRSHAPHPQAG